MSRFSADDWNRNSETIVKWSPFSSEAELLHQFNNMGNQGTRIIIYNLWEDEQGLLELDFDTDPHDIQIRGVNRDEKNIEMAKQYPNSRHFLTYRHSFRSYASILYLRIPAGFRIILRGKDVEHHNVVNDMMMTQEITYRPQHGADGVPNDSNMVAVVTVGFVKDAKAHIDVQGFNVYHKNRLIKPFWRLWHAPGSDGRGVIGLLEANFIEPAHDKQGFERTIVLSRLEARLIQMQKTYWSTNCHKIGYAPRRNKKFTVVDREVSPDRQHKKQGGKVVEKHHKVVDINQSNGKRHDLSQLSPSSEEICNDDVQSSFPKRQLTVKSLNAQTFKKLVEKNASHHNRFSSSPVNDSGHDCSPSDFNSSQLLDQLKKENHALKERLTRKEKDILGDLLHDLQIEKHRSRGLETQVQEATRQIEELNKEQESLIDIFSEERERRDIEEENLRKRLKDASNTIQELLDKVKLLEMMSPPVTKLES